MAETIVSVHQPNFMPWIKLLDKILASDVYVPTTRSSTPNPNTMRARKY